MSADEFVNHDDDLGAAYNSGSIDPGIEFVSVERGAGTVTVACHPYSSEQSTRFVFCSAGDSDDMKELFLWLDNREIVRMFRAVDQLSDVIEFERAMKAVREAVLAEHLENKAASAWVSKRLRISEGE